MGHPVYIIPLVDSLYDKNRHRQSAKEVPTPFFVYLSLLGHILVHAVQIHGPMYGINFKAKKRLKRGKK